MVVIGLLIIVVKKTKAEIAAQKVSYAVKEKSRRVRRKEQERNMQRKNAVFAGKTKKMAADAADADADATSEKGEDGKEYNLQSLRGRKRAMVMRLGTRMR
jgi:hypothetical protein